MDEVTPQLWIGNIRDAREGDTGRFDATITICQDDVAANIGCEYYDHYPLADGEPPADAYNPGSFSYDLFREAVERIIEHVTAGRTVFVHCHAGKSRSVMAVTAALTELEQVEFDTARETVIDARKGGINPSRELSEFGQRYANGEADG